MADTPATAFLKAQRVAYSEHEYEYVEHGDRKVSTKNLARQAGVKRIEPCRPEAAQRHSGYQMGGTSPFGTKKKLAVYLERSILELARVLAPELVDVALAD
ncbi:MAG: YbaK/EbsC family protein [Burkholderiales bacterium]